MRRSEGGYSKEIRFTPAFDRRNPNPKKNYGIHGVEMAFYFQGPRGAIQFVVYTNWQLPHVTKEQDARPVDREFPHLSCRPLPADVGYHSPKQMHEGQTPLKSCALIKGDCYYDGSGLRAYEWFDLFVTFGEEKIWELMKKEYDLRFPDDVGGAGI